MSLRLDFCGHEAALFACKAWHYSGSLPASRRVCVGVWENGRFTGCLVFSRGAVYAIGSPYGLRQSATCELTRIALSHEHHAPVSRILAIALRLLKRQSPGLRLIVSYSDPERNHDGRGVYAAGNWIYVGLTKAECLIRVHGRARHPRTMGSRYGTRDLRWLQENVDANAEKVRTLPKHKYLYPMDAAMGRQLEPLRQPHAPGVSGESSSGCAGGPANPRTRRSSVRSAAPWPTPSCAARVVRRSSSP